MANKQYNIPVKLENTGSPEPLTYSIPIAGSMAGLARNASYAAARRGEIPVIKFGGKCRVPAEKWKRILAEGCVHSEPE